MRTVLLASMLLATFTTQAAESPYDKFSAKNNFADNSSVKWVQVDNIQEGCNAEARKRGFPDYKIAIDSCSFWHKSVFGNTCLIMTPRTVDYWTFGHELRHCFQGSFHKY